MQRKKSIHGKFQLEVHSRFSKVFLTTCANITAFVHKQKANNKIQ